MTSTRTDHVTVADGSFDLDVWLPEAGTVRGCCSSGDSASALHQSGRERLAPWGTWSPFRGVLAIERHATEHERGLAPPWP
jgi:hypothetical protein